MTHNDQQQVKVEWLVHSVRHENDQAGVDVPSSAHDEVANHAIGVQILHAYVGLSANDGVDRYVVTRGYEDLLTSDDEVRCEKN